MNRIRVTYLYIGILLIVAVFGCTSTVEKYGEKISVSEITQIKDIFSNPREYNGRIVKLEGEIVTESSTGHWFELTDEEEIIYVDLNPGGFTIPQRFVNITTVEGKVKVRNGKPYIIGMGVEIR